jgi:hypothetical protein
MKYNVKLKKVEHNKVIFPVGTKVRVCSDYFEASSPWRDQLATVIGHYLNTDTCDTPFVDNRLKFEDGKIEPFANWEVYIVHES